MKVKIIKKIILAIFIFLFPAICFAVTGYPGKPKIINTTMTTANTEYQIGLPEGTSQFVIQSRSADDFKMAFAPNETNNNYFTVKVGAVIGSDYYSSPILNLHGATEATTIFVQSGVTGHILETIYWH